MGKGGWYEVALDSGYISEPDGYDDTDGTGDDDLPLLPEPATCGRCGRVYTFLDEEGRDRNGFIVCWACEDADLRAWEAERAKGHATGSGSPPF